MVGNQKTKQSPSSLMKAKPEITAPILDSFPPLLPPATACDATNKLSTHYFTDQILWFFHDWFMMKLSMHSQHIIDNIISCNEVFDSGLLFFSALSCNTFTPGKCYLCNFLRFLHLNSLHDKPAKEQMYPQQEQKWCYYEYTQCLQGYWFK